MEENKKKSKKLKIWSAIAFVAIFIGLMFFVFSGGNFQIIVNVFTKDMSNEELRDALDNFGIRGYVTIGILSMFQVVLTFLPAEPVQVIAGVTFGLLRGGLTCLIGVIVGNSVIYILYKIFGQKLTAWFESNAEFDFESAKDSPKVALIVFILYFLPAIPYGLICFFAASLNIKYPKYIFLTTLGSIPSIIIGVGLGHIAIASSWIISLCVLVVLIVLIIILYKKKKVLFKKINDYMKRQQNYSSATKVRKCSGFILNTAVFGSKILFDRKVKIKFKNNVGKLDRPSIVLLNHGSFLDFVYAGRLLRKEKPHFIAARLYFYHKRLGNLMRKVGAFPKSMFSTDIESVKNSLKVLADGEILAMMPEARLSTIGRFEDVQESTYKFIKKMGVSVYYVKLDGDYFAKPKWADKVRKGAVVYASLNKLFSKEEMKNVTLEQLKQEVEKVLYYNEFEWLESMPNIHYKSKTLAKGLENILVTCPKCGAKYSIVTDGLTVKCSKCDLIATLNDRYGFVDNIPFKNFAEWYDWQKYNLEKEILSNKDFKLEHSVTLKHSSKDGKKMLREAGKGICTFDRIGLTYRGEKDGEQIEKLFPLKDIYRLLFGAGEDFEIYDRQEIWFFVPDEIKCCVDYYIASELMKKHFDN